MVDELMVRHFNRLEEPIVINEGQCFSHAMDKFFICQNCGKRMEGKIYEAGIVVENKENGGRTLVIKGFFNEEECSH